MAKAHPMIKSVGFQPKRRTLDEMRAVARGEADHTCNQKIDGKWLAVVWNSTDDTYRVTCDGELIGPSEARALIAAA